MMFIDKSHCQQNRRRDGKVPSIMERVESQPVRQELVGFMLTLPEGTRHVTCASWTHQSPSAVA
jgi:hypothetical protein